MYFRQGCVQPRRGFSHSVSGSGFQSLNQARLRLHAESELCFKIHTMLPSHEFSSRSRYFYFDEPRSRCLLALTAALAVTSISGTQNTAQRHASHVTQVIFWFFFEKLARQSSKSACLLHRLWLKHTYFKYQNKTSVQNGGTLFKRSSTAQVSNHHFIHKII
jgi:hypothetical protein